VEKVCKTAVVLRPKRGTDHRHVTNSNLITLLLKYLILLYDTKKKIEVRLCWKFAYELR
jgi:hypothetical protein